MTHLTLNLLLQAAALTAGGHDYATAFKRTEESGQPLVILIGADWCPGCQTMKQATMPELQRRGGLNKVAFAYVNSDHERDLAGKLMRGGSIPQLVVFRKTPDGWKRKQLTGAQSVSTVEAFIGTAVEQTADNRDPQTTGG